jgi:hypothetical protein
VINKLVIGMRKMEGLSVLKVMKKVMKSTFDGFEVGTKF